MLTSTGSIFNIWPVFFICISTIFNHPIYKLSRK
jgi:hypothetical protein